MPPFLPVAKPFRIVPLVLALLSCSESPPPPEIPRAVRAARVHYQNAATINRYSGEVRARHEAPLSFQIGGRLARRLVDVGARVKAGQVLATIDDADARLAQLEAEARVKAIEAELDVARQDLKHLANLMEKDLSSPASYQRRRDAVRAAEARLAEGKAVLALQQRRLGYAELRAEQAGVVTAVEAEAGQVLSPGQTVLRVARDEEKEVVINLPENRLGDLQAAAELQVSLWARPEVSYPGKTREISPSADALIRAYTVKVSILQADAAVRLGMTATVRVRREESAPTAILPLAALTEENGQARVWVIDENKLTVQPRPVRVLGYDAEHAKIAEGLGEGEWVAADGVHKLIPGQKVSLSARP